MNAPLAATEASPDAANEDAFRAGAGRYPGHSGGCVHSILWLVERLAVDIEAELATPGTPLAAATAAAIRSTCADHGPSCDLTDPLLPSAAVAILRAASDELEWLMLGECAVAIEHCDGSHTVVVDRVDQLGNAPIEGMTAVAPHRVRGRLRTTCVKGGHLDRLRRVDWLHMTSCATITDMAAPKGRQQREKNGERALYAQVDGDVIDRLNAGAAALRLSRGAYIELLVRGMPVDERGLPPWLAELAESELPFRGKGEERAAA